MSHAVPTNQPVSYTVYRQAIHNALAVPADFLATLQPRIQQAFEYGEPISMIVDELRMRWEIRVRKPKTPRSLAARVVRVG